MKLEMVSGTSAVRLSPERLADVEDEVGMQLPGDYVQFLRDNNGGVPKRQFFSLGANEKVVERFLSVVEDYKRDPLGIYDIEVVWSQIENRLSDGSVPIAVLFGGDFLCLQYDEASSAPKVVPWDHERSKEDRPFFTPIAPSFESFVTMLY